MLYMAQCILVVVFADVTITQLIIYLRAKSHEIAQLAKDRTEFAG